MNQFSVCKLAAVQAHLKQACTAANCGLGVPTGRIKPAVGFKMRITANHDLRYTRSISTDTIGWPLQNSLGLILFLYGILIKV
jgi:hypothetical protein